MWNVGLFGVYVGPMEDWCATWGSMEVSGQEKTTPADNFSVQCWAIWSVCGAHVGLFGGLHGVPWKFLGKKKQHQQKIDFFRKLFFETILGLCGANVGPFGVCVGPMLGH